MLKLMFSLVVVATALLRSFSAFANCASPVGVAGQLQWVTTDDKMKVCNGSDWTETVASADNSCAFSVTGEINYTTSNGILGYCYGGTLFSMKGSEISSCTGSPAGSFQYDSSISTYKYCNGADNKWYRMTASAGTTTTTTLPDSSFGYFVRTANTFTGLGGLIGANSKCATELMSASVYWNGKDSAGTLSADRIKAWLCDGFNCQNPKASSTYKMAGANLTGPNTSTPGGASIAVNSSRIGPNNSDDWSGSTFFGTATAYWTARAVGTSTNWPDTSSSSHCVNLISAANAQNSGSGVGSATASRWNNGTTACGTALALVCMVTPEAYPGRIKDCTGSCVEIFLTDTSLSTWTVPTNWNNTNNKIEVIGGGAGGRTGIASTSGGGGGGGGGYAYATNVTLTPGASVNVSIGISGAGGATPTTGGATWFGGTDLASSTVGVNGGGATTTATGGSGGTVVRGTGYTGGNGGTARASSGGSGGGGGGAAGPFGPGGNGGGPSATGSGPGGGGGGGGTHGGNPHPSDNAYSGPGGSNVAYNGAGAAVLNANSVSGGDATIGGGGGCTGAAAATTRGGHGGNGIEWATRGSGGGGGAGCTGSTYGAPGGNAGMFGGGGGGGGTGTNLGAGGAGSQGLIRITYTP